MLRVFLYGVMIAGVLLATYGSVVGDSGLIWVGAATVFIAGVSIFFLRVIQASQR